jgi:phospholipid/cholesterol/gamma-HCH transport system substrate-binding protein
VISGALRRATLPVLLAVVLLASGCGLIGGGGSYQVTAYFPRAVSVFPSSQVRVLGLPAGTVTAVEVEGDRVRIDMDIDDSIPLPVDVTAELIPQSLIGERYVQLSPAFRTGMPRIEDGHVIPLERTIVPVEPDEALEALREFLDSLDPDGLGTLITNLEEDLRDLGEPLGESLGQLSELVATFAESDDTLVRITDSFDRLTTTLATRESQIGEVLAAFGEATQILADERASVERLVEGLARVSQDGLDLIGTHAGRLRHDIEVLTQVGRTIDVNLDRVAELLDSGPILISGFDGEGGLLNAYNHEVRAINLRNSFSPLTVALLQPIFDGLGLELPCIDEVQFDTVCAQAERRAVPAAVTAPRTPVDDVLDLLSSPTETFDAPSRPGTLDRVGSGLDRAVRTLLGVGR